MFQINKWKKFLNEDFTSLNNNEKIPKFAYHYCSSQRTKKILESGIMVNQPDSGVYSGELYKVIKNIYNVKPVYLSLVKTDYFYDEYDYEIFRVNIENKELYCDIPMLIDNYAYYGENSIYWEDHNISRLKGYLKKILKEYNFEIPFIEFQFSHLESDLIYNLIRQTGTCCVLENIPPSDIKLIEEM